MAKAEPLNNDTTIQEGWCNNFRGWISYRYLVENNII